MFLNVGAAQIWGRPLSPGATLGADSITAKIGAAARRRLMWTVTERGES